MKLFYHIGRYFMLLSKVFKKPQKLKVYVRQIIYEIDSIGISSLSLVAIISVFMGGIITIQAAFSFTSPLVPIYAVGFTARESMLLEFSPTVICLILAGKVGSNIASEIGAMRITEQIDALEIMGINSAGYLIFPKVAAAFFIFPFLIALSMFLGLCGGFLMGVSSGACTAYEYVYGIQAFFEPWKLYYAFTKVLVFAFIITSVSSYYGYHTEGGALEVGKSSTNAVVYSSILILFFNLVLTSLFFNR
ncbi:MAG: ABC transporter permease [Bacteroidota bacterium]|jgi:phospholipid/cholesterol/gamma-HCH transport system permease protein